MKLLMFLILLVTVSTKAYCAENGQVSGNGLALWEIFALLAVFYALYRLFPAKEKEEKPTQPQPNLTTLVKAKVGELNTVSGSLAIGGNLLEKNGDVDTHVLLVQVNKKEARIEEANKMAVKLKLVTAILTSVILVLAFLYITK